MSASTAGRWPPPQRIMGEWPGQSLPPGSPSPGSGWSTRSNEIAKRYEKQRTSHPSMTSLSYTPNPTEAERARRFMDYNGVGTDQSRTRVRFSDGTWPGYSGNTTPSRPSTSTTIPNFANSSANPSEVSGIRGWLGRKLLGICEPPSTAPPTYEETMNDYAIARALAEEYNGGRPTTVISKSEADTILNALFIANGDQWHEDLPSMAEEVMRDGWMLSRLRNDPSYAIAVERERKTGTGPAWWGRGSNGSNGGRDHGSYQGYY